MKASDAMTFGVATVRPDAPLTSAIRMMIEHKISALPVVDDGGLVRGIISESDFFHKGHGAIDVPTLLSLPLKERLNVVAMRKVSDIMTSANFTINPDSSVQDVAAVMIDRDLRHLPVVDDGHAIGVISRIDVLSLLLDELGHHGTR